MASINKLINESLKRDVVVFSSKPIAQDSILERLISIKKKKIGIVLFRKSYDDIVKEFKKKKISIQGITFIDCMPKKTSGDNKNVISISSPTAYTAINIAIKKTLKQGVDFIIFDSLSHLFRYGNQSIVLKYLQDLILFVRDNNKKIFFLLLEDDRDKRFMTQFEVFVDKVSGTGPARRDVKADSVKLMKELFGEKASKLLAAKTLNKKPELMLKEFKNILSKLVGPENAAKQTAELYTKFLKK